MQFGVENVLGRTGVCVPMQTSDPLQEDIHRTQIGNQYIGINVQRLFEGLSANDHPPIAWSVTFSQHKFDSVIKQPAILYGEPAVVQRRDTLHRQGQLTAILVE